MRDPNIKVAENDPGSIYDPVDMVGIYAEDLNAISELLNREGSGASVWDGAKQTKGSIYPHSIISRDIIGSGFIWNDMDADAANWVAVGTTAKTDETIASGTNEVQTLTVSGTPTGGTFTVTFLGQETAPIAYNADAATIELALEALSNIEVGEATVAGVGPFTITFSGQYASKNVPLMIGDGALLTGGVSPSADIVETTPGVPGLYIEGAGCLKITDATAASATRTFTAEDWSIRAFFTAYFMTDNGGTLTLDIGTDASNYVSYDIVLTTGVWKKVNLELHSSGLGTVPTSTTGSITWTSIGYLKLTHSTSGAVYMDCGILNNANHLFRHYMADISSGNPNESQSIWMWSQPGEAGATKVFTDIDTPNLSAQTDGWDMETIWCNSICDWGHIPKMHYEKAYCQVQFQGRSDIGTGGWDIQVELGGKIIATVDVDSITSDTWFTTDQSFNLGDPEIKKIADNPYAAEVRVHVNQKAGERWAAGNDLEWQHMRVSIYTKGY